MTEQKFLELFNAVVKIAKPFHDEAPDLEALDVKFADTTIDSLDMLVIIMYLGEIFDISEESAKDLRVPTVRDLYDFIKENGKRFPEDLMAALEEVK